MELKQILIFIDQLVFNHTGRHLTDLEQAILQGTIEDQTYLQIANKYHCSEGHLRSLAAKLWQIISEQLGENIKKSNFTATLKRFNLSNLSNLYTNFTNDKINHKTHYKSLTDIPLSVNFYGRKNELQQLEKWMINEQCHLINIIGLSGIGKTALISQIADHLKNNFDYIIWCDLQYFGNFQCLITYLLDLLSQHNYQIKTNHHPWQKQIIQYLQEYRCLIIIDNLQLALETGKLSGIYQQKYQELGCFFKQIIQLPNQSCIITSSWEKPREICHIEGNKQLCKILNLGGLGEFAYQILADQGINLESELSELQELINLYSGNPLWLKIIAMTITDLFCGKVSHLWQYEKLYLDNEVRLILDQKLARLSDVEKQFMFKLSQISQKSPNLYLRQLLATNNISQAEIINIIQSLKRRCLLEQYQENDQVILTLPPLMREYLQQVRLSESGFPGFKDLQD